MSNARLEELRSRFQENPRRYFAPFANELRKAGDPTQAIAVCRTHLTSQPGHVSGHIVLGQALYEAGESGEAQTVFATALELDPENLIALRTLGEIAQVNGEFGVAREWYTRLLDADPRNHEVSQLLKDLPKESASPVPTTPSASAVVEEPTPKTVLDEVVAAEASTPATQDPGSGPRFHTAFTGSVPAYDPDRMRLEPVDSPVPEPEPVQVDEPFVDLQPTAQVDAPIAEWSGNTVESSDVAPNDGATDTMEIMDFGPAAAEPVAAAPVETLPDELLDFAGNEAGAESLVSGEQPSAAEIEAEFETTSPAPSEPVEEHTDYASPEPPHAVFAEHGFDGPVNDEIGWLTTPSAAYSDLEAAPEDWYAEGDEMQPETATAGEPASMPLEVPDVVSSMPEQVADSWFDEPSDAPAAEAEEAAVDEFWLPPELPRVTSAFEESASTEVPAEDSAPAYAEAEPEVGEVAIEPEPAIAASLPDENTAFEEPVIAQFEQEPTGESADVHVVAEAAEEAIFVDHHAEPEVISAAAEPEPEYTPEPQFTAEPTYVPEAEAEQGEVASEVDYAASAFDSPPVMDTASVLGHATASPDEAPVPMPAPFITETLAELYLQQGFKEEALSIYRQLLDRNPASQSLKDRIDAIERVETVESAVTSEEATERAASQSVRTFFSRLARRQANTSTPSAPAAGEAPRPETPEVPFASAASALANMFAASKPSESDESAASSLSGAFSDPAGRPSRAAERELSLDHLFRDVQPVGSQGANMKLDEFYSTPNATTGSTTEPDEGSDEPAGSDIRQFTAWLEGLRKK